jgi:AraC-like DNA-binding protein
VSNAAARPGTVRTGGLTGFPALVAELGGDPGGLLARCGLPPNALADADNVIPFVIGARLLHLAAEETGCLHFGLLLGQRQDLALLGPIGFLMQHSPDVRSALRCLLEHMHLHVQGAVATLSTANGLASLAYSVQLGGVVGVEQVYNVCMANEVRFLQLLCGTHWRPTAVDLCYRAPRDEKPFRDFFGVPVHFDRPNSAVLFSADSLDKPISSADPKLRVILQKYIQQIESQHADDFVGQLRQVIRTLLPTGSCTADRVAGLFCVHRRTLHRLLAAQGTTFEQVVDGMRREIALQILDQSDVKLMQLSEMLGYHEASAFTRAFRRWTSQSPSEWRAGRS